MKRLCIVVVGLGLIFCGSNCSRSPEKTISKLKVTKEKQSLIEKTFRREPNAPADAITEGGDILGEEFESPPS